MQDFINAFKRLEKLCSEVYGQQHGVTQYIDDLEHTILRSYGSSGGKTELERLKELRHMRNQMVHDANSDVHYTKADVQFLEDFYERIMNQTDPLAVYRKKKEASRCVSNVQKNEKPTSVVTPASNVEIHYASKWDYGKNNPLAPIPKERPEKRERLIPPIVMAVLGIGLLVFLVLFFVLN